MLSYQHGYHAGNPADVHKHAALCTVLEKLAQKDKPLTYIETHAGRGLYDLLSAMALKTNEAAFGIESVLKARKIPAGHPYLTLLNRLHSEIGNRYYPGSPFIAEALLRPTDTLHLMELHPQEYQALFRLMRYPNTHLHNRDGFEGALAICPPTPRRGMVFTDPSYEVKTEYEKTAKFVLKLHRKWAEGVIGVWYPILRENYHFDLIKPLQDADLPKFYNAEILFRHPKTAMLGSGILFVNTPFGTQSGLDAIKDWF